MSIVIEIFKNIIILKDMNMSCKHRLNKFYILLIIFLKILTH